MTVYKVGKPILALSLLLLPSSILFAYSHVFTVMQDIKWIIAAVIFCFAFFNFINLYKLRLEVDGDDIWQFSLFGSKHVKFSELQEIGVVVLKMRIVLILSDPERFVFVSSHFQDFSSFLDDAKTKINSKLQESLAKLDYSVIRKKQKIFMGMLAIANIFLIGSGIYNIIN